MKRIMCTLALISTVLVIGCNDSPPVGPETTQSADGAAKAIVPVLLPNRGKITLDRTVQLSITPTNATPNLGFLTGTAKFKVGPSPILVRDYLSVDLSMQATLKEVSGTASGTGATRVFSGESTDQVLAPSAGTPAFIVKSYEVQNTDPVPGSSMTLNIKYMILSGAVSVQSIWVSPFVDQF